MCKTYSKEWIFLKEKKKLNIKGTVLDRYQLEQYLEKIACNTSKRMYWGGSI